MMMCFDHVPRNSYLYAKLAFANIIIMLSSVFPLLLLTLLFGDSNGFQIPSRRSSSVFAVQMSTKKSGAGFNYDPSNYKDSNSVLIIFLESS